MQRPLQHVSLFAVLQSVLALVESSPVFARRSDINKSRGLLRRAYPWHCGFELHSLGPGSARIVGCSIRPKAERRIPTSSQDLRFFAKFLATAPPTSVDSRGLWVAKHDTHKHLANDTCRSAPNTNDVRTRSAGGSISSHVMTAQKLRLRGETRWPLGSIESEISLERLASRAPRIPKFVWLTAKARGSSFVPLSL